MNSEKELENLVVILGKINEQYTVYKETLINQREAIITNNIPDLTELLSKIESINENINRLENRCSYNVDILAVNAGLGAKTIKDIIKAFPEYDGSRLESIAFGLKKTCTEVKNISASNAELLEISRSIIKETMNTIMTQNVDPRDRAWRTYGNTGGYSRIVRRASVHIVNQRG